MCGIAGLLAWPDAAAGSGRIEAMTLALRHRGPDDSGYWIDHDARVALGHARLAIIDVSPQGHQPMASRSGRYVITYNGEIYNFSELRALLDRDVRPEWRGHSDTEVLLAAIDEWGLHGALTRSTGMFAFALWDRQQRELWLVRDRMGEKPLYYGWLHAGFVFGSELKSLVAAHTVRPEIDRAAVAEFMQFGYVPGPRTIYRGVFKVPPASLVRVKANGEACPPERYWSLDSADNVELTRQLADVDDGEVVRLLEERLGRAVRQQMVSDVPLGAFLSGGVDSSLIVALMQACSARPVRTFTIGFRESAFDEAPFARQVAQHLGTDHTEMYVTPDHALATIPKLPQLYDEPFADSSQIPTAVVAELTRRQVTVSLSGDGGDELFAGYPRYRFAPRLWQRMQSVPAIARNWLARGIASAPPRRWDSVLHWLPLLTARGVTGHRLMRLSQLLNAQTFGEMYVRLVSQWQPEDEIVRGIGPSSAKDDGRWIAGGSMLAQMRRWDASQYLPDDILVKVDRASMHVSLESRAPLLDHRVVELAFCLPEQMILRHGEAKWALKRLLDRYVPRSLIERPKSGFGLPLAEWLRGPLRDWAEGLLEPSAMRAEGLLDSQAVAAMWRDHLDHHAERHAYLWNVLMFQAWFGEARRVVSASESEPARRVAVHA